MSTLYRVRGRIMKIEGTKARMPAHIKIHVVSQKTSTSSNSGILLVETKLTEFITDFKVTWGIIHNTSNWLVHNKNLYYKSKRVLLLICVKKFKWQAEMGHSVFFKNSNIHGWNLSSSLSQLPFRTWTKFGAIRSHAHQGCYPVSFVTIFVAQSFPVSFSIALSFLTKLCTA